MLKEVKTALLARQALRQPCLAASGHQDRAQEIPSTAAGRLAQDLGATSRPALRRRMPRLDQPGALGPDPSDGLERR